MPGFTASECVLIAIVALVASGPDRLAELWRKL